MSGLENVADNAFKDNFNTLKDSYRTQLRDYYVGDTLLASRERIQKLFDFFVEFLKPGYINTFIVFSNSDEQQRHPEAWSKKRCILSQSNLEMLSDALTTKKFNKLNNYEYYEYIGDKIVNQCINNWIIQKVSIVSKDIRILTLIQQYFISTDGLSNFGRNIKLDENNLIQGTGEESKRSKTIEDCYEAIFGCLSLIFNSLNIDYGIFIEVANKIIKNHIENHLRKLGLNPSNISSIYYLTDENNIMQPASKFKEICDNLLIPYGLSDTLETGTDNRSTFYYITLCNSLDVEAFRLLGDIFNNFINKLNQFPGILLAYMDFSNKPKYHPIDLKIYDFNNSRDLSLDRKINSHNQTNMRMPDNRILPGGQLFYCKVITNNIGVVTDIVPGDPNDKNTEIRTKSYIVVNLFNICIRRGLFPGIGKLRKAVSKYKLDTINSEHELKKLIKNEFAFYTFFQNHTHKFQIHSIEADDVKISRDNELKKIIEKFKNDQNIYTSYLTASQTSSQTSSQAALVTHRNIQK